LALRVSDHHILILWKTFNAARPLCLARHAKKLICAHSIAGLTGSEIFWRGVLEF
jgi:hypothetical protein